MTETGKANSTQIAKGILLLILGLISLRYPSFIQRFLSVAAGIFLLVQGIPMIGVKAAPVKAAGILLAVLGVTALTVPLLPFIVGIIVFGLYEIYSGVLLLVQMHKARRYPGPVLVSAILTLILGMILTISPLTGIQAIGWFLGVMLIAAGISALAGIRPCTK